MAGVGEFLARAAGNAGRAAFGRGLRRRSRTMLYLGAAGTAVQVLHFLLRRRPDVYRLKLRPGEGIEVVNKRRGR